MKNLIATVALAAMTACGAQYPLSRVVSVADTRPVGVLSNDVEGIVRLYDETNLTPRVSAIEATASGKQDRLLAGDNVTLTPTGTGTVVVAAASGGSTVPDGWTSVSNAAMSARRPTDNVSHVSEVAEFGPWDLHIIDAIDSQGAPHECRLRELESTGQFVWTIYKRNDTNPNWWYSQRYSSREEAEQVTSFTTEGTHTGLEISRPVLSMWSIDGEHFITPVFVTNRMANFEAGLETCTNRVAALGPYTNRVAALELYTNRVAALEPYTNRAAAAVVSDRRLNVSIGERSSCSENAYGSFAGGTSCTNYHMFAWTWNGSGTPYPSQGNGTFAVNPFGGANKFFIGNLTLTEVIVNVVSNLVADGKLVVSTNGTSQAAEGWHVIVNPD